MLRTSNSRRDGDFASRRMPRTKGEYDRLRCIDLSAHCSGGRESLHRLVADLTLDGLTDGLKRANLENERLLRELAVREFQKGETSNFAHELVHVIGKVLELSQRIFPDGPVTFDYAYDPESPSDQWLTFNVIAKGHYKDYCDREFQWHEEVERIIPGTLTEFRLCVMPQR